MCSKFFAIIVITQGIIKLWYSTFKRYWIYKNWYQSTGTYIIKIYCNIMSQNHLPKCHVSLICMDSLESNILRLTLTNRSNTQINLSILWTAAVHRSRQNLYTETRAHMSYFYMEVTNMRYWNCLWLFQQYLTDLVMDNDT